MRRILTTLACGLVLAGCGDDDAEEPASREQIEQQVAEAREAVAEAAEATPEVEVNPCDVLTEELIRANLPLPDGAEIQQQRGRAATNLCSYHWDDPDFDEAAHRRDMMKRMQEQMRKGGSVQGIIEGAMAARNGGEVSYTHMPASESEEAAQATFESAMRVLNRGISQDVEAAGKTTKVTFQASTEEVDGVGDQAHWSPRMQQLSVRDGRQIFHLTVKVEDEPEQNLELAKKLARAIIES